MINLGKKLIKKIRQNDSMFIQGKQIRKDGTFFPVEINSKIIKEADDEYLVVVARDITERKKSEKKLRDSEENYRLLVENSSYCIHQIDMEGRLLSMNPAGLKMAGKSKESDILGKVYLKAIGDADKDRIKRLLYKAYQGETSEFEFRSANNCVYSSSFIPITDENARIIRVMGITQDITDRKKAEDRLMESEKRRRGWLESSPVCTKIVDLDFNLQYMSAAGVKGLKVENVEEYYGKPFPFDFYSDSVKKVITKNLKKVKKIGESIEQVTPAFDAEGNKLWFYSTFVPVNDNDGRIDHIMVVSSDITKRKQAEEALISSKLNLEQKNIALNEIIAQIEIEKNKVKENIMSNVDELLMPSLKSLKRKGTRLDKTNIDLLEKNLRELSSTFGKRISEKEWKLTPKEIKICDLIRGFRQASVFLF